MYSLIKVDSHSLLVLTLLMSFLSLSILSYTKSCTSNQTWVHLNGNWECVWGWGGIADLPRRAPFTVLDFQIFSALPTFFKKKFQRVNFILPTLRPWSQTLQWCSQEAAKYPWQRRQKLIPCHYMIKIMNSNLFLNVYS